MSYNRIPAGKELPHDINVVIEIPANHDPIKYEINKDCDHLFVDRFVATPMFYPANYGYIPETLSEDGDALDVLVVSPHPVVPGSVIRSRPIGVLKMVDESGPDAKVIAVPHKDLTTMYDHVNDIHDLHELILKQTEHYFENYKDLEEHKWVKIDGWYGVEEALKEITFSRELYLKSQEA
jgi:inorganic pyrophosphatase